MGRERWALAMGTAIVALQISNSAHAQAELTLEGTELHIGERQIDLGCEGRQARTAADRVFVACGERGVVIVDLATEPARLLIVPQPSAAIGVFVGDDTVWVRLADGTARPLALDPSGGAPGIVAVAAPPVVVDESAPPVETPEPPRAVLEASHAPVPAPPWGSAETPRDAPRPAVNGRVTQVQGDRALVRFDGVVEPGMIVEFSRTREEELSLGRPRAHVVARGIVEAVRFSVARVQLETNASVEAGMHARTAGRGDSLWLLPPMPGGVFQGAITVRTFLPIQTLALGVLMDLSVSYLLDLGDIGLRFSAELTSLGFALFAQEDPVAAVGHGMLSFATRWFELGAGVGASTAGSGWMPDVQTGFSFAQMLRLGAEDGLMIRFRTNVVIAQSWTGDQAWSFGDLYIDTRIPVGRGAWIVAGGGGGTSGARLGEAGVRLRLLGSGRGGSVLLSIGGGFGWLDLALFQHAGPMVSIGLEVRP